MIILLFFIHILPVPNAVLLCMWVLSVVSSFSSLFVTAAVCTFCTVLIGFAGLALVTTVGWLMPVCQAILWCTDCSCKYMCHTGVAAKLLLSCCATNFSFSICNCQMIVTMMMIIHLMPVFSAISLELWGSTSEHCCCGLHLTVAVLLESPI